jgi:hypothetical protein
MSAPPVPAEGDGEPSLPLSERPRSVSGGADPGLVLSGPERTREGLLAASVSLELIRVAAPSDSRVAARYTSQGVDNSRALAGSEAALHLSLLRGHLVWLRGLPTGCGELKW